MDKAIEVLLVDDDPSLRRLVELGLTRRGFSVTTATNGDEVFQCLPLHRFDVLILDQQLPGLTGLQILNDLRPSGRAPEVVMITGFPTVQTAVEALKGGAFDFISKPFDLAQLTSAVEKAAEHRRLKRENSVLRSMVDFQSKSGPVVAESPALRAILERLETVAPFSTPVLITGETGTGKGLLAKTLHQLSDRNGEAFLQINCGALQEELFESELFGHVKGAFTGAVGTKPGLFEVADGGTLFLDEIGEMKPPMQTKLLQVLDSGEVRPVGSTTLRTVDVRIVAATNRDLEREVAEDRFRKDLYYRLNVVGVEVPPLQGRPEDITGLVKLYLERFRRRGGPTKRFALDALEMFKAYHWPGNVRQLANVVENLVLLTPGETITAADLPGDLRPVAGSVAGDDDAVGATPVSLAEAERFHVAKALAFTDGRKAQAARLLKIDVKTLNRKIRGYGIEL